jgi:hypothetical protein
MCVACHWCAAGDEDGAGRRLRRLRTSASGLDSGDDSGADDEGDGGGDAAAAAAGGRARGASGRGRVNQQVVLPRQPGYTPAATGAFGRPKMPAAAADDAAGGDGDAGMADAEQPASQQRQRGGAAAPAGAANGAASTAKATPRASRCVACAVATTAPCLV